MDREFLTSPQSLRWFPWKLYTYVFGAALCGWGVGVGTTEPGLGSLIGLLVGCILCVLGFNWMRPYMHASQEVIREIAASRDKTEPEQ